MDNITISAGLAGIFGLIILILEYIIGKTTWVKPNSTLDLIINILINIPKIFKKKDSGTIKKR